MSRVAIRDFQLANPFYKGATVNFYTVSAGVATAILATLYESPSGSATLANPQKLDSRGKQQQPIYVDASVVAEISGLGFPSHRTGIINSPVDSQFFYGIPQTTKDADYTFALADAGQGFYHDSASAHTWTIPSNAAVAYRKGTTLTFENDGTGAITLAINSDTLVLSGTGATGSRTLARYGMATAVKVGSTRWMLSGTGLS